MSVVRRWPVWGLSCGLSLFGVGTAFADPPEAASSPGESSPGESESSESEPGESEPSESESGESESSAESGSTEATEARADGAPPAALHIGTVTVEGAADEAFHAGGSVHVLGEEELETLNYDDPLAVLVRVPGVYVRQEDGSGLRPNIGLRGASSERSRKITLMEDGVLLAPAPYSAPAAYYFPLITRMTGVEVLLGPASIPYGPETIGGAVNLIGRPIPSRREGHLDLALGTNWFGRFHAHYGDTNRWGGFLAEVVHTRTSGFRQLDWSPSDTGTGYDRTDIQLRGDLHGDLSRDVWHRLELTLGLGLEGSNESYLGISEADLRAQPQRRYGASSTDRMNWWRTRAQLRYEILAGDDTELTVTAYRHDLDRTWQRLDRFAAANAPSFYSVLRDPTGVRQVYYEALLGTEAVTDPQFAILRVRNQRRFISQGVQAVGRYRFTTGEVRHQVEVGVRAHYDEIERHHTGQDVLPQNQSLTIISDERTIEQNRASAFALSGYIAYRFSLGPLELTPGIRAELVWMDALDRLTSEEIVGEQRAFLPGMGIRYAITDALALFGGVHRGFSPVAPGQPAEVLPESSWNFEIGGRYGRETDRSHGQVTAFVSDYENLTGDCSGAGGCTIEMIDRQFNGGRAIVLGVEASVAHEFVIDEVRIPLRGAYTFTHARFGSDFDSENPQWGNVRAGFGLPYIPEHQGSVQGGFAYRAFRLDATAVFVSAMRDIAGIGDGSPQDWTDGYGTVDAVARLELVRGMSLYVRGENLTNAQPIVSRRPYGARAGKPFQLQFGMELDF